MQRKSHKLLYLLTCSIILLAGLLVAASPNYAQQEEPYPVEVRFADNVTLEQASTIIAQTNATLESQWIWQIDYQNSPDVWSGGLAYQLNTPIQPTNDEIWRKYVGLVTSLKNSIAPRMEQDLKETGSVPPNRQRQYDANLDELKWLQTNIIGCWEDHSCPAFPIKRVTIMATQSTIDQLESSTLVQKIDPVFPPIAFFLMKALGVIPAN